MINLIYKKPCHGIHVTGENDQAVFNVLTEANYESYRYKDANYITFYPVDEPNGWHRVVRNGEWLVLDPSDNTVVAYTSDELMKTFFEESWF